MPVGSMDLRVMSAGHMMVCLMGRLERTSRIGRWCRDEHHITPTQELDLSISPNTRQGNVIGNLDMEYVGLVHFWRVVLVVLEDIGVRQRHRRTRQNLHAMQLSALL
jgi:trimethylamine:corrinoid methyltransferase-like protein